MGEHAIKFGLDAREYEPVRTVSVEGDDKVVQLESGAELRASALILAAGGLPRKLEVPGEEELAGRGVSYCAVCDGAFFKGEELAVVGGGDAALEEGDFLTRYASKVHIVHRRGEFRAQPILQDRARANPKIGFIMDAIADRYLPNRFPTSEEFASDLSALQPICHWTRDAGHHPAKCTVRYANTDGPNVEKTSEMPARLNL